MTIEGAMGDAVRIAKDVTDKMAKGISDVAKKVWSVMDAASEKKPPSSYLGPRAIESMQGKPPNIKE